MIFIILLRIFVITLRRISDEKSSFILRSPDDFLKIISLSNRNELKIEQTRIKVLVETGNELTLALVCIYLYRMKTAIIKEAKR